MFHINQNRTCHLRVINVPNRRLILSMVNFDGELKMELGTHRSIHGKRRIINGKECHTMERGFLRRMAKEV